MKIMKLVIGNSNNPYMTKVCTLMPVLNPHYHNRWGFCVADNFRLAFLGNDGLSRTCHEASLQLRAVVCEGRNKTR